MDYDVRKGNVFVVFEIKVDLYMIIGILDGVDQSRFTSAPSSEYNVVLPR